MTIDEWWKKRRSNIVAVGAVSILSLKVFFTNAYLHGYNQALRDQLNDGKQTTDNGLNEIT